MACLEWIEAEMRLNVAQMDDTHREFIEWVQKTEQSSDAQFSTLFEELLHHTEAHFANENALMAQVRFFATPIHQAEHAQVLRMMQQVAQQVRLGNLKLGREYLCGYLPGWFRQHAMTMDSALASCVRTAGTQDKS